MTGQVPAAGRSLQCEKRKMGFWADYWQCGSYPRTRLARRWVGILLGNSVITGETPYLIAAKSQEIRLSLSGFRSIPAW